MAAVFWQFLLLGCVSFGGPAAHIGYFKRTFVDKKAWLGDEEYARLIALSQFLPGPGSSQVGFAIGMKKAGILGGIAAFLGFTLPSFLILYGLSVASLNTESHWLVGIIHGLKLLAVVVVADATLGMFQNFCQRKSSQLIAVVTAVALLVFPSLWLQLLLLVFAAATGMIISQSKTESAPLNPQSTDLKHKHFSTLHVLILVSFVSVFALMPLLYQWPLGTIFADFYYAGSFVFGGGHVVLPLLQQIVADNLSADNFLTGYAAAQAVPGPMFTLATFLGAQMSEQTFLSALTATLAIFLPGILLLIAFYRSWESLASQPKVAGAAAGINAAVVGLLISALFQPVFVSAVLSAQDFALALLGFAMLRMFKPPILLLVFAFVVAGVCLH
ncbi:chromate efflux transporter [Motilimonas pumila]|uniref:Chromate efflux transporter n=1 Tax=Motilimonas pumila TaxID=2303987 RepID=A0A418Y9Y0_9GAMM|nr:chromate efflux transporter [Motilimonas pumila]RJG38603.1 chromate efflux transporter [Motilimonas pumila]